MSTSSTVLEATLIKIFRRNQVTHENGRLPMNDLSREWCEEGGSDDELATCVAALVESGMLMHEPYEGQDGLTLTRIGVEYMATAESLKELSSAAKHLLK